ncbi:HEPN domain-containing protein [Salinivibrio kushneri]|uniref:RiboL-PSP-HEPN domain-containing protein n=1 Tax=Salinivibrio kushneri TaxID=1908198 RepID=A0AB36K8M0_9GAMM|nr:HEPN domain-containing protein [Salinivibrio kushneri]OOE44948.1 hypothetical protein BZG09_05675 [Salinivibrio kushneri]
MDIDKIIENRKARESRNNRPFATFMEMYLATEKAQREVAELRASTETQETILKSHVINIVTAVEVYYRDILDAIFKMCAPSSFENKLKKLHDKSYKIDELVAMYAKGIHPLELIASNHSFQNTNNIDKVFTIVTEKPFLKQVRNMKWRIADKPESESEVTHEDITALQDLFEYRHTLIHNPNQSLKAPIKDIEKQINSALGVVMASDLILSQYVNDNIEPEPEKE